jgi:ligand-binding SRPBCC domain-containing protein
MSRIETEIIINAPKERCFLLALSVDLQVVSAKAAKEKLVAGKPGGIMEQGDSVTWLAKHFGMYQKFSTMIVKYKYPDHFSEEMMKGPFKNFKHEHYFHIINGKTLMKDELKFELPQTMFGKKVNTEFLNRYLENYLDKRSSTLRIFAESDRWMNILTDKEIEAKNKSIITT